MADMDDAQDKSDTPTDVVGNRLTIIGAIGAVVVGVIWFAQRNSHEEGSEILGDLMGSEAFNNTPYAIALAVAVGVLVLGLVLRSTSR